MGIALLLMQKTLPIGSMAEELELIDIEGDDSEVNLSGDRDLAITGYEYVPELDSDVWRNPRTVNENDIWDAEEGGLIQDQYLHSAWTTSRGLVPWTLDSSVSAENRAAIENMLLEEEYYLAGKELPKSTWTSEKQKVKRPTGQSVRWAEEEKVLFEKGLAQFGRRWTKISKLIGSRSVLQVKSYARQYFKNKAKLEDPQKKPSGFPWRSTNRPSPSAERAPSGSAEVHVTVLPNAVRIERLSDDEDVDITNDIGDDAPFQDSQTESPRQPSAEEPLSEKFPCSRDPHAHTTPDGGMDSATTIYWASAPVEETDTQIDRPGSPEGGVMSEREDSDGPGPAEGLPGLEEEYEEEELKAPEQEVQLDKSAITDEEKQAISEFFEGRPSKTPERYLKIRNYILDQWEKCKPKYLNKTSVRPGLKNCGDVNCIGRIHTYLELIGAINFGCEQAVYNRPRIVDRSKVKVGKDTLEAYQLAHRLQSMRTRKRRVRDMWGNWCDAKDLEGQTFEHLSAEDLAKRREESCKRQPKSSKVPRQRGSFDPFQLIPCNMFGQVKQEPFKVKVCPEALIVMDMHAHVSMSEVIGLLGGEYDDREKVLRICAAEPCNSLSTGMQCEMDPVSQTQASELLAGRGYSVVGWYHSHPAFDPNPSLRDIDTQAKFQGYFSRGGAPFIGMIVSPYNPRNASPHSQTTCLVVSEEHGPSGSHKIPFKFDIQHLSKEPNWEQVMKRAEWVVDKYKLSHNSVPMDRFFRRDSQLTCLEKMLASLRTSLEQLHDSSASRFLTQVEKLFVSEFCACRRSSQDDSTPSGPCSELSEDADTLPTLWQESGEASQAVNADGTAGGIATEPANQDGCPVIR